MPNFKFQISMLEEAEEQKRKKKKKKTPDTQDLLASGHVGERSPGSRGKRSPPGNGGNFKFKNWQYPG